MSMYEIQKQLNKRGGGQNIEKEYLEDVLKYYSNLQVVYISPEKEVMLL